MTKSLRTIPKKLRITLSVFLAALLMLSAGSVAFFAEDSELSADFTVNLSDLTVSKDGSSESIKVYTTDDLDEFTEAYTAGKLPDIYITKFIFDGTGILKKYSLDDDTKEIEVEDISITAININTAANVEFTGTAEKTMIMINSNTISGDINLILNNVSLTSTKKTPAVLVANKDVTSTSCNVTIIPKDGTENYISGGKISKTSLMDKDSLTDDYATYSGYYGIYSADELEKVIFAKETADAEKLAEGAPKYYFHESGAISSDTALTFKGSGKLEVVSLKDEGIETKGDLIFTGGTGDYSITSLDDCLNASTSGTKIYIDVNSMLVNVSTDADEGDGIDSNGYIYIEGGTITARASAKSQDAGIDSDSGTYINGGTVAATGNMSDEVKDDSKQGFIYLNFGSQLPEGTTIVVTDSSDNPVIAYKSDRTFTNLVLASSALTEGTYHVYKDGELVGTQSQGLYTTITSYTKGTQQCYTSAGSIGGPGGQAPNGQMTPPDMNSTDSSQPASGDGGNPPEPPTDSDGNFQAPSGSSDGQNGNPPQPPTDSDGNTQTPPNGQDGQNQQVNSNGSVDFELTSSQHTFSGVTDFTGESTDTTETTEPSETATQATTDAEPTTESTETTAATEATTESTEATQATTVTQPTTDSATEPATEKASKKANTITVKAKTKSVKYNKTKKSSVKIKNAITVTNAKGSVSYKKLSGSKKLSISKNGTITVKKGTKKGTYKIKVKVTAKGNSSYKAKSKTVTVKVKVK